MRRVLLVGHQLPFLALAIFMSCRGSPHPPPESARDSLPSVARLSGPVPDPWLCALASQRVCLYREEGYALILYSTVNPIGILQENLTPGALGHLGRRAPMRRAPRRLCHSRSRPPLLHSLTAAPPCSPQGVARPRRVAPRACPEPHGTCRRIVPFQTLGRRPRPSLCPWAGCPCQGAVRGG